MTPEVTAERLKCICSLRREISNTKRRIARLERKFDGGTGDPQLAFALCEAKKALCNYLCAAENEEAFLISYIQNIPDASVRELFMLRYVDGIRSWQKIAFAAGEHDESYVRRKHNAYLKNAK